MDKIETDCIWVILKSRPVVFQVFMANPPHKVVFAPNHLVSDVTIILSVKEFHITIFEL